MCSSAVGLLEDVWWDKIGREEEARKLELTDREHKGCEGLTTEMFVAYERKSTEGNLCAAHTTSLGKVHFTSNMFKRAVQCYEECLSYEVDYLDKTTYQAQSLFILGKYQ